jgi:hypothetical protein
VPAPWGQAEKAWARARCPRLWLQESPRAPGKAPSSAPIERERYGVWSQSPKPLPQLPDRALACVLHAGNGGDCGGHPPAYGPTELCVLRTETIQNEKTSPLDRRTQKVLGLGLITVLPIEGNKDSTLALEILA